MEHKYLVLTKTHAYQTTYDFDDERYAILKPELARHIAVQSEQIPCWVTDGKKVYRVTALKVDRWEWSRLRYREVGCVIEWLIAQTGGN